MKIAIIGNQDNNAYRMCNWMRAQGHNAELFTFDADVSPRSQPEGIDRHLVAEGYPSWIHKYKGFGSLNRKWLKADQKGVQAVEDGYDVALTSGYTGVLVGRWLRNIPFVHMSLGDDVTTLPLLYQRRKLGWNGFSGRAASLAARESLRNASAIVTAYCPTMLSIERLGLGHKIRVVGFPEDVEGNISRVDQGLRKTLLAKYAKYDRVLLWLSRLNFTDASSSEYKGVERFLDAFRRLVFEDNRNVRAVVGAHGNDVDEFKQLVRDWGLEPYLDFVPHLPYWKLLTFLSLENAIVCDEIDHGKGEISGMAREALSVGAVVVKTLDHALVELCWGNNCPIIDVRDAETTHRELLRLVALDQTDFRRLQQQSLQWARQSLDYSSLISRWVGVLGESCYLNRARMERLAA